MNLWILYKNKRQELWINKIIFIFDDNLKYEKTIILHLIKEKKDVKILFFILFA